MARKFQNIAFGYAIPSYSHNIESTLHICVHVYYITSSRGSFQDSSRGSFQDLGGDAGGDVGVDAGADAGGDAIT